MAQASVPARGWLLPGAVLVALIVGSLLLAAVLAPWAHAAATLMPGDGWPLGRVFTRLALVLLLAGLFVLRRHLGLELVRDAWSGESWRRRRGAVLLGVLAASASTLAVLPLVVASTRLDWSGQPAAAWAAAWLGAIPAALLVSAAEQTFFRALLFRGLARHLPVAAAAVLASVIYGAVHFLAPAQPTATASGPLAGLEHLARAGANLLSTEVAPAVLGLTLIGLVLCTVLARTGSLALCIGLHAGWFAAVKVAIRATTLGPELAAVSGVPKRLLMTGSPWVWLAVTATGLALWAAAPRLGLRPPCPERAEVS